MSPLLDIPAGDGESAFAPPFDRWEALADANRESAEGWRFEIAGVPASELRSQARSEVLEAAARATASMDGRATRERAPTAPIVLTGHQPLLYHPGVWAKVFAADALASRVGGTAVECVVDSDAVDRIALTAPCADPPRRCAVDLAVGREGAYFGALPAPGPADLAAFREKGLSLLRTLGAPDVESRFDRFCGHLHGLRADAPDVAWLVTAARRAYEEPAGMCYMALPVTAEGRLPSFLRFSGHLALDAARFRAEHNAVLGEFRGERGIRSAVRPFRDLGDDGELVELPLWHLDGSSRASVWADGSGTERRVVARGETIATISDRHDPAESLGAAVGTFAPRAVALTLFNRLLVADLFVHGAGGASYDMATDALIRRYFAIEPPTFAATTLTMRLPLELPEASSEDTALLRQRLHRLAHNPDSMIDEADLAPGLKDRAGRLAAEKASLIEAISAGGADKRAIGSRIREVNEELAALLGPLAVRAREELDRLERGSAGATVLADRTYPFCLWDPIDVRAAALATLGEASL